MNNTESDDRLRETLLNLLSECKLVLETNMVTEGRANIELNIEVKLVDSDDNTILSADAFESVDIESVIEEILEEYTTASGRTINEELDGLREDVEKLEEKVYGDE